MIDRKNLRKLCRLATQGPWVKEEGGCCINANEFFDDLGNDRSTVAYVSDHRGNSNFIAAARNALPELLDLLDEAERAIQNVLDADLDIECRGDEDCDHCVAYGGILAVLPKLRGEHVQKVD